MTNRTVVSATLPAFPITRRIRPSSWCSYYFDALPPEQRKSLKAARKASAEAAKVAARKAALDELYQNPDFRRYLKDFIPAPKDTPERIRKNKFRAERVSRDRLGQTLGTPCWHEPSAETDQEKYVRADKVQNRKGELCSASLSQSEKVWLANNGYPQEAFAAMQTRAHLPCLSLPSDRKSNGKPSARGANHQESPTRRTYQGGGFTQKQVEDAIREFNLSGGMQYGLLRVVHGRQSPSKVALKYSVNVRHLKNYASKIKKTAREKMAYNHIMYLVGKMVLAGLDCTLIAVTPLDSQRRMTNRIHIVRGRQTHKRSFELPHTRFQQPLEATVTTVSGGRFSTRRALWLKRRRDDEQAERAGNLTNE